ncbi:hypothetical protein ABIE09_001835 [Lysobacter enzymogenes]|uniref:hypothetical protein n=1 Tax=Lysobacter enzymogenes TaxID=69 RepID=UPI00339A7074
MHKKSLLLAAIVGAFAMLYLPARFVLAFEIFGKPVKSMTYQWLGPTPRDAEGCIVGLREINAWECEDQSVFERHAYGCELWLRFFGYADR